jgi:hypothetical protein
MDYELEIVRKALWLNKGIIPVFVWEGTEHNQEKPQSG